MPNLALPIAAVLISAVFANAAFAQTVSPPQQNTRAAPDPNEIVCEKQPVIGSRLAHTRVCMTRSQWEDARRQDRQETEKAQTQIGMPKG